MNALKDPRRAQAARATAGVTAAAEQGLSALARLAATLLRARSAYVTILDDAVQRIVAGHEGSPHRPAPCEVPVSRSLCRFVIERRDLVAFEDVSHLRAEMDSSLLDAPLRSYLGVPLADAEGQQIGVLCVTDVMPRSWTTEERLALRDVAFAVEGEMRRAIVERRYQIAMHATGEVLYSVDLESQTTWREGAIHRLFGIDASSDDGDVATWTDRLHPDDRPRILEERERAIAGTAVEHTCEYRLVHPDGRIVEVRDQAWIRRNGSGVAVQIAGRMCDVTRERNALESLQRSERWLRKTLETIRDGIVVQDAQDRIELSNPAACRILGITEDQLYGRSSFDPRWKATHPDGTPFLPTDHPSVVAMRTGEPQRGVEMRVDRPDGSRAWLSIDSQPMRHPDEQTAHAVLTTFRDVTRERELQAELLQAQKLEALGRFAGGIAHDFNNLLTVIGGCAELLMTELPAEDHARADVQEIRRAVDSARTLTRQLLAFSRQERAQPRAVAIGRLVADTANMVRRIVPPNTTVHVVEPDDEPLVLADAGQLEQILMNLVVNASDAMPDGGTISIRMERGQPGTRPAEAPKVPVFDAPHVTIAVSDTGTGMPETVRQRAFDPFFTTKPPGKGTGLGLSTIWGIVTGFGGTCWITSATGVGTTVRFALPEPSAVATSAAA